MRQLKVKEALPKDVGRAIARIDPEDMKSLGLAVGQIVQIEGKRKTAAKVMPCYAQDRGKAIVQIDGITRENTKTGLDEKVTIQKIEQKKMFLGKKRVAKQISGEKIVVVKQQP